MKVVIAILALVAFVLLIDVGDVASSRSQETQYLLLRLFIWPFLVWGLIHWFASWKNLPGKWWFSGIAAVSSTFSALIIPFIIFLILVFHSFRCANCASVLKEGNDKICEKCGHKGPAYKPSFLVLSASMDGVIVGWRDGKNIDWFFTIDKVVQKSSEMITLFKQENIIDIEGEYRNIMLTCASAYYIAIAGRDKFPLSMIGEDEMKSIKKKALDVLQKIATETTYIKDIFTNQGEITDSNLETWPDKEGREAADVEVDLSKLSLDPQYLFTKAGLDDNSVTFFERDEVVSKVDMLIKHAEDEHLSINAIGKPKRDIFLMFLAAKFLYYTCSESEVRPNWVLGKWTDSERMLFLGVADRFFISAAHVCPELFEDLPLHYRAMIRHAHDNNPLK